MSCSSSPPPWPQGPQRSCLSPGTASSGPKLDKHKVIKRKGNLKAVPAVHVLKRRVGSNRGRGLWRRPRHRCCEVMNSWSLPPPASSGGQCKHLFCRECVRLPAGCCEGSCQGAEDTQEHRVLGAAAALEPSVGRQTFLRWRGHCCITPWTICPSGHSVCPHSARPEHRCSCRGARRQGRDPGRTFCSTRWLSISKVRC